VGRLGIERQYESVLRGSPGVETQRIDRRGRSLEVQRRRAPVAGHDVRLSLDMSLERAAQGLLDAACRPRPGAAEPASGGAAIALDVATGEVLLAASAPGFSPAWFTAGEGESLAALFASAAHPLVNRATQMAIPPGSVFKTLAAVAMVEMDVCDPEQPFHCQGYLHEPDRQRCLIFRHQGIGHGDLTLADALARSCNVYFFHHADLVGPEPLLSWAKRFGFGRPTGIDLPDEAAGTLPTSSPDDARAKRLATAEALAIGQGTLTVTPLQVVRLMAAVANGGQLVRPRLVLDIGPRDQTRARPPADPATPAESHAIRVSPATLAAVREGLRRTVADPEGTAHSAARLAGVALAGKTGTAQTSGADHAWFAGYAPADEPRVAIVVVLEHGGAAGNAARLARELVARIERLGYFAPVRSELVGE
jgi:penicillin-binding protein 2